MPTPDTETRPIMSPSLAVFNLHVNDAGRVADEEFIRLFGPKRFDRHIAPSRAEGIMSIFAKPENMYRVAWIAMVTVLVNCDRTSKIVMGDNDV